MSNWGPAFKEIILVQPRAAAERVLSLLQSSFTYQQNNSLEDASSMNNIIIFKSILWLCGSIMGNSMSIIGKIPGIAGIGKIVSIMWTPLTLSHSTCQFRINHRSLVWSV